MLTIGVLVDVSGSMKESLALSPSVNDSQVTRAESIFRTIMRIAECYQNSDDRNEQNIFVSAFGLADQSIRTCDFLSLLEYLDSNSLLNTRKNVDIRYDYKLIQLLRDNGAPYCQKYIFHYLKKEEAEFLYYYFSNPINKEQLDKVIYDLPHACKYLAYQVGVNTLSDLENFLGLNNRYMETKEKEETRKHVKIAIDTAKLKIRNEASEHFMKIREPKTKTLKETIQLLNKITGNEQSQTSLSSDHISYLVSSIDPFIYGSTPMCESIKQALETFKKSSPDSDKFLFILTDGEATDGNPLNYLPQLKEQNVTVFVCLITSNSIDSDSQKRLYYKANANWREAEKNMFELSSEIENTHSAMSVLLEHKWKLPKEGRSRLFVQANHPDVLEDFRNMARRIMDSNDALLNIAARVSLDQYINSAKTSFIPNKQIGGTCYANAVAAVLHLAMRRIEGREGGVPPFSDPINKNGLLEQIVKKFGDKGASTENVLAEYCSKYRLHCKKVDENGAREAINARRPVVARFSLYPDEWVKFGSFYESNKSGILERTHVLTDVPDHSTQKLEGHAVVLTRCEPNALFFMNSWGVNWADGGFFKIKDESVLRNISFYDVYWIESELKPREINAYEAKKKEAAANFLNGLPSGVKELPYECPKCHVSSRAVDFIGNLIEATCPKCNQRFTPTVVGLVLNSY